jgi:hypothetical protein
MWRFFLLFLGPRIFQKPSTDSCLSLYKEVHNHTRYTFKYFTPLIFHLCHALSSYSCLIRFLIKVFSMFFSHLVSATYPYYWFREFDIESVHKLGTILILKFLQPPNNSSALIQDILLMTLFSNIVEIWQN